MGKFLRKGVGFLLIPIYTKYLLTTGYGTLELLDLLSSVIGIFVGLQLGSAVVRFYYEYDTDFDKQEVVTTALISIFVIAGFIIILALCLSANFSQLIFDNANYAKHITIALITLALTLICSIPESHFVAKQNSLFYTIINLCVFVSYLALNIFFIVVAKKGVLGILYSSLITKLWYTIFLLTLTARNHRITFSFSKFKKMAKYSMPLIPASMGMFILNYGDRFLLQKMTTISDVGIYALGYKFGYMLPFIILQPIQMIWGTQIFEISKKNEGRELLARMFTYIFSIIMISALSLSLFSEDFIKLMAPGDFHDASKVVPFIVLAYVFMGMFNLFQAGPRILKKTSIIGCSIFVAAIINVIANLFLIPKFNIMGAAYSTAISFLVMFGISFYWSQRVYFIKCEWNRIFKIALVSIFIFALSQYIGPCSFSTSIALKSILIVSFPLWLYLTNFFQKEERAKIVAVIRPLLAFCCRNYK